jgi:hypothetical protein
VLDSEGNPATTDEDFEFRVLVDGDTSELIGLSDDLPDSGQGSDANRTETPSEDNNNGPFVGTVGDNTVFQYNPSADDTDEQGTFYVYVANDLNEEEDVQILPRGDFSGIESDTGTATFFASTDSVTLDAPSTLSDGESVNVTATAQTSDGTTIEVPRLGASFDSDNSSAISVDSDLTENTDTSGVATGNITAEALGEANLTATVDSTDSDAQSITVEEAADDEPTTADVELDSVDLSPSDVDSNTTNEHTLTFDALNVSDDGNTDTFNVTIPDAATLESADSVTVTDAADEDVSLDGGPDVSGNEITFDVAPDTDADTRDLSVEANVTVSVPEVSEDTDADITIGASDSDGSSATASATLTISADDGGDGDGLVEVPGGVEIPSEYVNDDGGVGSGGLGDAALDFRNGDIDSGTLGDVALGFRES